MTTNSNLEILQLHYYLSNGEHSMDAKIYNSVESELLKIIEEISKILDLEISIEIQALEEGGIRSIYKFLSKKKNRRNVITAGAFFAGVVGTTMSSVIAHEINSDPEMEKLKKQKIELEIQKLKKELNIDTQLELKKEDHQEVEINSETIDSLATYISEINKIKIARSKFYKSLSEEVKIEKVSTQELDENYRPVTEEKIVPRRDFKLFIVNEAEIDSDYQYDAELEIVSPVLKRNRMSWKAIHNEESITFSLKDEYFKNLVISKNLQFSNGTKIICELETKQKMDSAGKILKTGRLVYNVSKLIYPDGVIIDIKNS
jgi:hypothetical protein